jgi:hypothetical protein
LERGGLRQILKNSGHRDVWDEARTALALAKAYEAGARRAKRATGVTAAEAAHDAAIDHLADVSQRILAAPWRSLAGPLNPTTCWPAGRSGRVGIGPVVVFIVIYLRYIYSPYSQRVRVRAIASAVAGDF